MIAFVTWFHWFRLEVTIWCVWPIYLTIEFTDFNELAVPKKDVINRSDDAEPKEECLIAVPTVTESKTTDSCALKVANVSTKESIVTPSISRNIYGSKKKIHTKKSGVRKLTTIPIQIMSNGLSTWIIYIFVLIISSISLSMQKIWQCVEINLVFRILYLFLPFDRCSDWIVWGYRK